MEKVGKQSVEKVVFFFQVSFSRVYFLLSRPKKIDMAKNSKRDLHEGGRGGGGKLLVEKSSFARSDLSVGGSPGLGRVTRRDGFSLNDARV